MQNSMQEKVNLPLHKKHLLSERSREVPAEQQQSEILAHGDQTQIG